MEFNINLLPQSISHKERRSIFLVPVLAMIVLAGAGYFAINNYFEMKDSVKTIEEKIIAQTEMRDSLISNLQERSAGINEMNFVKTYILLNQLLDPTYESAVELHAGVLQLLPENAKIDDYSYTNNGDLKMTITFHSKGDSAKYLHELLSSDFVAEAGMETIYANEEDVAYESIFNLKLNTLVGE